MRVRCPNCHDSTEVDNNTELSNITCNSCGGEFSLVGEETITLDQTKSQTIGHFELVDQLGTGAFGSVWLAQDTQLDRSVAIKIPRKGQLDPSEAEQFIREARAAAQLKHPNIVAVHEVGREDGQVYIVSDYVDGLTLADWLVGQQLTSRTAAELCLKLAEALHHAHEAGVIHRDLKPTNIILNCDNEPHIMDFGLAKREAGEVTMTMEGKVLGTPAYMSPEQAKGEAHQADRRSDVYSLGVILYELLTGHKPFRGNVRMLLQQVIHDEAPSPRRLNSTIPRDLETLCLRCLEKDPRKRYPTARDMADELNRFLKGEPIKARPITTAARGWRWCRRNPVVASLGAVLAAVLLILGIVGPVVAIRQTRLAEEKAQLADETRRLAYVGDMSMALQEWTEGNVKRVVDLLRRYQPQGGEEDLRAFEWYHLWNLCRRPMESPTLPHDEHVYSVAFAPDGKTLASASKTKVTIWNVETKTPTYRFHSDDYFVWHVAFSPDGKRVASANYSNTVKVWNLEAEMNEPDQIITNDDGVFCVAFSPVGDMLASGHMGNSSKKTVLWNASTREELHTFPGGSSTRTLAFSPDSRLLATGSDSVLTLWEVASRTKLQTLPLPDRVLSVAFSADADLLAVRSIGQLTLWNPTSSERQPLMVHTGEHSFYGTAAFSGHKLAFDGAANKVKLWDTSRKSELDSITGHSGTVTSVAFSPKGDLLASGSFDGTVKLWDLTLASAPDTINAHTQHVVSVSFSPDGAFLASAGTDGVRLWETETWSLRDIVTDGAATSVVFSRDSKTLAYAANRSRLVEIWGVHTRQTEKSLPTDNVAPWSVSFSRDGKYLAAGLETGVVKFWDPAGWRELPATAGHSGPSTRRVVTSPDSKFLASGNTDSTVLIWDLMTREHQSLSGHLGGGVFALAFSPDSGLLASGGSDHTIRLWDVVTEAGRLLTDNAGMVTDLAFSRDGTLASAADRTVRLWDVKRRQERAQFRGHSKVVSLAFSPDGNTLVAGLADGSIMLWQAATEQQVRSATWWASLTGATSKP